MAKITYTAPVTQTRNEARLESIHFMRIGDDRIHIEGVAVVGYHDGTSFDALDRVSFSTTVPLATAVTYFGTSTGPILAAIEGKTLEWMQAEGLLPPGTIS